MKTFIKIITGILIISALIIAPGISFAQEMDKPYVDFSNDTTLLTTTGEIAASTPENHTYTQSIDAYFSKKKGYIYLHLIVNLPTADYNRSTFAAGTPIFLKLTDNTIVTLSSLNEVVSKRLTITESSSGTGIDCWSSDLTLGLSSSDLQHLSSLALAVVRVQAKLVNIDFDSPPQESVMLKNMIQLITAAK